MNKAKTYVLYVFMKRNNVCIGVAVLIVSLRANNLKRQILIYLCKKQRNRLPWFTPTL